jgi:acyl-CoA synthetase (AMP-forming)/AMP-acid ligase II
MLKLSIRSHYHTLHDAAALRGGDEMAIIYVETDQAPIHVSRSDFRRAVIAYAAALQGTGIAPHDLVIIAHTQNLESIYAFWGALWIGAIPSMFPTLTEKLDPDIYMQGLAELAARSGVRAVLTTDDFAPVLAAHMPFSVYGSSELYPSPAPSPNSGRGESIARSVGAHGGAPLRQHQPLVAGAHKTTGEVTPDDIALLQHSSGTTGLQKGVALSHRAVLNQLASYSDAIALNEDDVIVSWLPLYHDMGLIAGFLLPLVQGVPLVLMSPFDWVTHPALLFRAIHDYRGTLCWLPNFAYNHCARRIRLRDLEGLSAATMRMFVNCSEPVYAESHALFLERFAALGVTPEMLAVSYAMAENTFGVTQTPPGEVPRQDVVDRAALEHQRIAQPTDPGAHATIKVSCGKPIANTAVRVLDDVSPRGEIGNPLPERRVGELAVQSDCMLTGYYQRPDLEPFKDGWYLTGDRGYIADGEVYVVGRSKDLIINAGKNIYPQDIEALVNTVPGVHAGRAVVFGVHDAREGTELIAVVAEVETETTDERQAIDRAIRLTVAQGGLVTVSYLKLVDSKWLIKTSSGKIARAANREKWLRERGE